MIVKPKIDSEQFFKEDAKCTKKGTYYKVSYGPVVKPIILLEQCVVKFGLGRFDKMTLEHNHPDLFEKFNDSLKKALGLDAEKYVCIKDSEIGVKVHTKDKKESAFQKYDVVDVLIEFNDLWLMAGKIYPSFILKDIKLSPEHEKEPECLFTFDDIN